VMTGFRVHPGGAQTRYGVAPDLTALGKVIGGGLPVGAYGGRRDIMEMVAPAGPVYQAGTLSGNPLAMAAGLATLDALTTPGLWDGIAERTARLAEGLADAAREAGLPVHIASVGTMFTLFFTDTPVTDWATAASADTDRYARFFRAMLDEGVYLPPSQFEACFLSAAHTDADLDATLTAARRAFRRLA
ncbi:MAG: aminotransferase class III-fold pyridoxal phosphate-dependent enzyme, partial [Bacteroidetes bacterium]